MVALAVLAQGDDLRSELEELRGLKGGTLRLGFLSHTRLELNNTLTCKTKVFVRLFPDEYRVKLQWDIGNFCSGFAQKKYQIFFLLGR
jgi:hypothetical protein